MYNKAMPHGKTSCLRKKSTVLRVQLEQLYAQRSAVDAAIEELELRRMTVSSTGEPCLQKPTGDFSKNLGC
jgi:wyosine [tRNA(Phe)-imidazoG37] synthetase (radical SAM superfamily)